MKKSDYISTTLIDLLNSLQEAESADSRADALGMITDGYNPWMNAGYPLLTPRAKAVLAAVEEQMDDCDNLCEKNPEHKSGWCDNCVAGLIRKAHKEKP